MSLTMENKSTNENIAGSSFEQPQGGEGSSVSKSEDSQTCAKFSDSLRRNCPGDCCTDGRMEVLPQRIFPYILHAASNNS